MLQFARRISRRIVGRDRQDLEIDDEALGGLLVRELAVIGEAASHISPALRAEQPAIAWSAMVAMRNRLIHGYSSVNWDIVWDTCTRNIPVLIEQLEQLLTEQDASP
jgi:uncharacterized protein with HEPN domain